MLSRWRQTNMSFEGRGGWAGNHDQEKVCKNRKWHLLPPLLCVHLISPGKKEKTPHIPQWYNFFFKKDLSVYFCPLNTTWSISCELLTPKWRWLCPWLLQCRCLEIVVNFVNMVTTTELLLSTKNELMGARGFIILFVFLKILVLFLNLLGQVFWSLTASHFFASECHLLFFPICFCFWAFLSCPLHTNQQVMEPAAKLGVLCFTVPFQWKRIFLF